MKPAPGSRERWNPLSLRTARFPMVLAVLLATVVGRPAEPLPQWQLVWSDEFDQPDGSAPNPANWTYDTGGGGWGNQELETYTPRRENSRVEQGMLVIEARKETFTGPDGRQRNYTSARLKTLNKRSWQYGRFEARMKLPAGQGIWPAFWMMGTNFPQVNWPACGEIDIMENIGREPSTVYGTAHGPKPGGSWSSGGNSKLPAGRQLAADFHVYALEWETNRLTWYFDGLRFFTATPANMASGGSWVFTQPEFLLLNVAVGGVWPGNPDATSPFPQQLQVDYVRVYARSPALPKVTTTRAREGVELVWPATLPMAKLEISPVPEGPWTVENLAEVMQGTNFRAVAAPGFHRLRWDP